MILQIDLREGERELEYKVTEGVKETLITEPNGSVTKQKFNTAGEPTEIVNAYGTELTQTTKYEYSFDYYTLLKETDANNNRRPSPTTSKATRPPKKTPTATKPNGPLTRPMTS